MTSMTSKVTQTTNDFSRSCAITGKKGLNFNSVIVLDWLGRKQIRICSKFLHWLTKNIFFYLLALACLLLINKTLFIRQSRMLQFLHLLTPKVLNSFLAASVEITNVVTFSKRYLFDLCNKYTTDDLIKMRKSCPTLQLFIRCERWRWRGLRYRSHSLWVLASQTK